MLLIHLIKHGLEVHVNSIRESSSYVIKNNFVSETKKIMKIMLCCLEDNGSFIIGISFLCFLVGMLNLQRARKWRERCYWYILKVQTNKLDVHVTVRR